MTGKKFGLALFLVFGLGHSANSFAFNPCFSILGNYTITGNNDVAKSGGFDVQNRKVNFGFELTNKFSLHNGYFIRTGIRYSTFKTTVNGQNQASVLFDVPYQISWAIGYQSIAVPIQFGKDFITENGHKGDFYAGLSVGILTPSGAGFGTSSGASSGSGSYGDTITTKMQGDFTQLPSFFLATADFGFSYQPIRTAPRFSMGVECSIQLTKTKPYSYQAVAADTHGNVYTYDLQHQEQFTNCAVSLSYRFGKQKSSSERTYMLQPTN